MKIISNPTTVIDERGFKVTSFNFSYIEEPGDEEREIEQLRERANFLSQNGHPGNRWERLLRAKEENYARNNSAGI